MSLPTPTRATPLISLVSSPWSLWVAFITVHVWLMWLGMVVVPGALGDVSGVYSFWMNGLRDGDFIVGVTTAWVYPLLAIAPMWLATLAGMGNYVLSWLVLVTILDVAAFAVLVHARPRMSVRSLAAWWWILSLIALGPVALGRIDAIVTPLAIVGLLYLATRPALAGILLAAGAWMKVWPGALLIAAVMLVRRRFMVLASALVFSALVIFVGLIIGAGPNMLSFMQFQGTRGLQIESPGATGYLWAIVLGDSSTSIYFDQQLLTYQIQGPETAVVSSLMTWLMAVAVVSTLAATAWRARASDTAYRYVPAASLALVMALIAFNKVGSPQYLCWVIPPILLGLIIDRAQFVPIATVSLVLLVLTQMIYPWLYDDLLEASPLSVFVLSARNVLEIVLFVWSLRMLVRRA